MPILEIQRRMMELGRIRMGDKGAKGQPQKLSKFRLTSASRALLEAAAASYGGTVKPWENAPDEGYFELYTTTDTLDIMLPPVFSDRDGSPTAPYSQWYESWTAGGCERRCDGEIESLSGKPCMCNPDDRACKVTTRVNVMLPQLPGIGVWRLESHGWNAATLLPGTLEILRMAAEGNSFIPAVLRLEHRTSKKPGEVTRKFIIPVIDLPGVRVADMLPAGAAPLAINPPAPPLARPALPAAVPLPAESDLDAGRDPDFGSRPKLPIVEPPPVDGETPMMTGPQKKKANLLVGKLRDAGHITTEMLYRSTGRVVLRTDGSADYSAYLSEDGELHWSPLREMLTKAEAIELIDRLETFAKDKLEVAA